MREIRALNCNIVNISRQVTRALCLLSSKVTSRNKVPVSTPVAVLSAKLGEIPWRLRIRIRMVEVLKVPGSLSCAISSLLIKYFLITKWLMLLIKPDVLKHYGRKCGWRL